MARKKDKSFFEIYAHEYDLLTDAQAREVSHNREVLAMIKKFEPTEVLDAGCASGLTSMLFARHGITTVGLDRSGAMIKVAKENYCALYPRLTFTRASFEKMPARLHDRFDLVACLANSISGAGTMTNLRCALKNFWASLKPGGWLVLQLLNYGAIKEGQLFPIKATEKGGIVYERFSERRGKRIYIYITRLDLKRKPMTVEVFRHEFDNFTVDEILRAAKASGFYSLRKYSDLSFDRRFTRAGRDLVLVCQKPL